MTLFGELQQWLADQPDDQPLTALEQQGYVARHLEFFAACQRRYVRALEHREARALMSRRRAAGETLYDALASDFGRQTYLRVGEALRLVVFSGCQRLVMVGCGPFPAAALYVYDHESAPDISALDNDANAVEMARQVVAVHAPERVHVFESDGSRYDYSGADVVYIANLVSPKADVLARIADTASSATRVILRDPFAYGKLFAERGLADLDGRFVVTRIGEDNRHFFSKHFLLARRPVGS